MVPLERLALEHYCNEYGKYSQRYHLLNDLQLHQIERAAVFDVSDPVGRDLRTVLEERNSPREQDYKYEWPACGNLHFL